MFSSCPSTSQSRQSGEIRGTVTDTSGALIAGVQVIITNVQTGVAQQLTTDSTGVFEAPFVPPGEYSIAFEKDGFQTYVRNGIVLHVETIKVDAALTVGSVSVSVTVTALQPLVQTENAERGLTLSTQVVEDVPNVGRSWDELLGTLPGVNVPLLPPDEDTDDSDIDENGGESEEPADAEEAGKQDQKDAGKPAAKSGQKANVNLNLTVDSTTDPEKLEKQLKLLRQFGML
jgi:hypothetical protein